MRFSNLKKNNGEDKALRDLNAGLTSRMKLDDQLNTFVATVSIATGGEGVVFNRLRKNGDLLVPNEWIVIDSTGAASGSLGRGPTPWTKEKIYLKNYAATDGVFTVRFIERDRS